MDQAMSKDFILNPMPEEIVMLRDGHYSVIQRLGCVTS